MESDDLLFSGLKVIDCASYIAGPAAATILSDYGADVVKIEPPEGDPYRELYRLPGAPASALNYAWDVSARDKRSLALDLKQPEGVRVLHRMVRGADVFLTNMPLPVRARLGIDAATLLPLNPRLIYASMTAYGESGPESDKTGFDATAYWARSGLMDMVRADHTAAPARSVAGMGDHPSATALYATIATALYRRERTGRGGVAASSLLANGLWANAIQIQAHLSGVTYPPRPLRTQAPNPFGNIYRCRDGRWLSLAMLNEAKQMPSLFEAMEYPRLLEDERFATTQARRAHNVELIALFDHRFAEHDLAEWRRRLDAAGITFGVIGTLEDTSQDEQMRAIGALVPMADGSRLTVSNPLNLDGEAKRRPGRAPTIGEHSTRVLRDAGFGDDEIRRLHDAGVIRCPDLEPAPK